MLLEFHFGEEDIVRRNVCACQPASHVARLFGLVGLVGRSICTVFGILCVAQLKFDVIWNFIRVKVRKSFVRFPTPFIHFSILPFGVRWATRHIGNGNGIAMT